MYLLSDNGIQCTLMYFHALCKNLRVERLFTTVYHPQTNDRVKRLNQPILSASRHYMIDNQSEWDLVANALRFVENTTVPRMTCLTPCKIVF